MSFQPPPPPPPRFAKTSKKNEPDQSDPENPPELVKPLDSRPFIDPLTTDPSPNSDSDAQEKPMPDMIFLPFESTREEKDMILETNKSAIVVTGAAASVQVGPILGLVDIGENEDSYLFRVSLPGVLDDENFYFNVDADGKVSIRGATTTGEKTVCKKSQIFVMQSQNLCPPGHFSVSFKLPGPVDPQQITYSFEYVGILEAIVKKKLP